MHYKYSMIMTIVFVTMLFGTGMPVLFPIATMSFLLLYIVEKFMLYYGYREPPQFGEELNDQALKTMKYAPVLLLSFGFWMLSSRQLIHNKLLIPKVRKSVPYDSNHWWYKSLDPVFALKYSGPAGILLIAFWLFVIYLVFESQMSSFFQWIMRKICFRDSILSEEDLTE
jgi:hypothetical protein